jgi:hypothetical protein
VVVFDKDGRYLQSFGSVGKQYGQFARPKEIAADRDGNVYVVDSAFGNFQIFNPEGELLLFVGDRSERDGPAKYMLPSGIAVDEDGRVYVVDQWFRKIDVYRPAAVKPGAGFLARRAARRPSSSPLRDFPNAGSPLPGSGMPPRQTPRKTAPLLAPARVMNGTEPAEMGLVMRGIGECTALDDCSTNLLRGRHEIAMAFGPEEVGGGVRRNAGCLAARFQRPGIGGNCRHQTQPGLRPRTRRTQPGLGHGRDLRLLPHAARRRHQRLPRRCGTSGSVPTAPRPAAVRTPRTTRCRRRRWTATVARWVRSRWPACPATTARRRWTTSSTRRAPAAYWRTGGGNDGRTYTWTAAGPGERPAAPGVANLGTDLSNDHPIGIQYCGGGLSGSGTTCRAPARTATSIQRRRLKTARSSTATRSSGSTPAADGKQRTDLPLYTAHASGLGPMVECASCHDPHVSKARLVPTARQPGDLPAHLQRRPALSARACHVK